MLGLEGEYIFFLINKKKCQKNRKTENANVGGSFFLIINKKETSRIKIEKKSTIVRGSRVFYYYYFGQY